VKIVVNIPVEPTPMPRPKVFKMGSGQVVTVTPGRAAKTESMIREYVMKAAGSRFRKDIPLKLSADFVVPKPKSAPRKRRYPVTRPDLDQYLKLLMDALNKYLWEDDSQVVAVCATKRYGELPSIGLEVESVEA